MKLQISRQNRTALHLYREQELERLGKRDRAQDSTSRQTEKYQDMTVSVDMYRRVLEYSPKKKKEERD